MSRIRATHLYPKDIYAVLFDPLPFTAHGASEYLAAAENTVILVLVLRSLRQLVAVFRVARWRPYVMACLIYSASFLYVFAALGNLGLIEESVVCCCRSSSSFSAFPSHPKGKPPTFPWEKRRVRRRDRATTAALTGSPQRGAHRAVPKKNSDFPPPHVPRFNAPRFTCHPLRAPSEKESIRK